VSQPLVQHCFADCDDHWADEDPEQAKGLQSADRSHEGAQKIEPQPQSFGCGYCTDDATCSVSMLNFETATCAAVPDLAVVAPSGTDGSALSSAVA
jgi:hypothetical protein